MAGDQRSDPEEPPGGWYGDVAATLQEKSADDVARELSGLVDVVTDHTQARGSGVDHYVVGVSFTKRHTCFDYAVEAVLEATEGEKRVVETIKAPTSESHRYVHFVHPPDPHFDASALRARLVAAVDRERREAAEVAPRKPGFADLWEDL